MRYFAKYFILILLLLFNNISPAVQVDTSLQISPYEKNYENCRVQYCNQAIKKYIGSANLNANIKLPRIDFCFSGGGDRALISCLGFLMGSQTTNLINTAISMSALSGSTWLICMWMLSGQDPWLYKNIIQKKIVGVEFYDPLTLNWDIIIEKLENKRKATGHFNAADLWGSVLCARMMDNLKQQDGSMINKQVITFNYIRRLLNTLKNYNNPCYPFPILTSSITCLKPYQWLEINPFYTGGDTIGGYIPTENFGGCFNYGWSQNCCVNEESIATFMGICGSAYSISFWDILKNIAEILITKCQEKKFTELKKLIQDFLNWYSNNLNPKNPERLLSSNYFNYTYNMPFVPLSNKTNLELADAGMIFNLPFPPLLKRKSDIIIVCDASSECPNQNYSELHYARTYATTYNFKFPCLDNPIILDDYTAIFESDDPETPTIIYFQNPIKESTFKFNYTQQEFDAVCYNMSSLVINHKVDIANAIIRKINKINGFKQKQSLKTKIKNKLQNLFCSCPTIDFLY
ncbi:hypothetical protein GF322_04185 [Candidatus Dependentiae bacterium]|nr:hypothetical protein [Candidatus Dependentiae bacterium]